MYQRKTDTEQAKKEHETFHIKFPIFEIDA